MAKRNDAEEHDAEKVAEVAEEKVGFGIDIGGSGIKGAPVHLTTGELLTKKFRLPTPEESSPEAVGEVVAQVVQHFHLPAQAKIGITFPGIIKDGVAHSAANMDKRWVGTNVAEVTRRWTGHEALVANDADAAGYAEVAYGAAEGQRGTVLVITLGTGIGSGMFYNGWLVPNFELGHLDLDGHPNVETWAASSIKDDEGLSYSAWAERLQRYFAHLEFIFSPDLFVVGGGVSKDHKKFLPLLDLKTPIVPAKLRNKAGIVGAAALAAPSA